MQGANPCPCIYDMKGDMKTIEVTETEYNWIEKTRVVLAKDQTAEVKPTKDGVRVSHVKREEVKSNDR